MHIRVVRQLIGRPRIKLVTIKAEDVPNFLKQGESKLIDEVIMVV